MSLTMRPHAAIAACLLAGLALVVTSGPVEARPAQHGKKHPGAYKYSPYTGHRHYYPAGRQVSVLPGGYLSLSYAGLNYYFHGGTYYRRTGRHYNVVRPPVGLGISVLPAGYRTYRHRNRDFYFAGGIFYRWDDFHRHYVVVDEAETGIVGPGAASQVAEQYVYPRQGQDATQTSRDRYECYLWAAGQSGVEPALASTAETEGSLQDYQRANAACLEARGYSVK